MEITRVKTVEYKRTQSNCESKYAS